jgi:hypothetical protein
LGKGHPWRCGNIIREDLGKVGDGCTMWLRESWELVGAGWWGKKGSSEVLSSKMDTL